MRAPLLVAGLGNTWMRDDGIGSHVVRVLAARAAEFPGADFLDAGTAGMRVLHALPGRRAAAFVDCARLDQPAGSWRWFEPHEVGTRKSLRGLAHEGDVLAILALSRSLGECPERVGLFGIQPAVIEPGETLSPALEARLPEYADRLADQVRRWLAA